MNLYVAGFMFSSTMEEVLLIEKKRPAWQSGLLNGPGGRVLPKETDFQAMVRKFRGETGIYCDDWRLFCTMTGIDYLGDKYQVSFYTCLGPIWSTTDGITNEEVRTVSVMDIHKKNVHGWELNLVPNLRWLIPMSMDVYKVRATVTNLL